MGLTLLGSLAIGTFTGQQPAIASARFASSSSIQCVRAITEAFRAPIRTFASRRTPTPCSCAKAPANSPNAKAARGLLSQRDEVRLVPLNHSVPPRPSAHGERISIAPPYALARSRDPQIIEATFSSPMMRASERTSFFWSSRSWNSSGIAADFSCWTSSASGSIGTPTAFGLACRPA